MNLNPGYNPIHWQIDVFLNLKKSSWIDEVKNVIHLKKD